MVEPESMNLDRKKKKKNGGRGKDFGALVSFPFPCLLNFLNQDSSECKNLLT